MKKTVSKVMALLLIVFVMLSSGACSKKKDDATPVQGTSQGTSQGITTNQPAAKKLPIVDKPLTLTIVTPASSSYTIGNDMMTVKELEARTNIHLEWELLPAQGAEEKFNLIMMSGKLPDCVSYNSPTTTTKYAMEGAFIPLEEPIKKYAPNIQKIFTNPPYPIKNAKAMMSAGDGHIYNIPIFSDNYVGELFFINELWLKRVNMKVPTTTDELYAVLKAFKDKDANGNGQPDEIPYSGESKLEDLKCLMCPFGAHKGFYEAKDGTIKFSPIDDKARYLEGLNFVRKLFAEGLIDQEIVSETRAQYDAKATTDKIGMIYAWSISGADAANAQLKKINPDNRFIGMLPVKGPHGDQFKEDPQAKMVSRFLISKDNKNVEATMKWLDYMFTEEGRMLLSWGIEGKTYNMVNGMPKRIKYDDPAQNPQQYFGFVFPNVTYFNEMKDSYSAEVVDAFNLNTKANVIDELFPNLPLNAEDQSFKAKVETDMKTYIDENLSKLMMGVDPISKFDSYIEGFNKIGVDKLKTIYNTAYKKFLEYAK